MRRLAIALVLLALVGAACGDDADEDAGPNPAALVRLRAPATGTEVEGNVVKLDVSASGVEIVKADGDTSGRTAHYHVFIDRPPVAPGEAIPVGAAKEETHEGDGEHAEGAEALIPVVHTAASPILLTGLHAGQHQIYVVLGDGTHHRLGRSFAHTSVHVKGPSVDASAPATAKVGEPIKVDVDVDDVRLVAANGDTSGATGHLHVFIDREPTPAGEMIPREPNIIHTAETSIEVPAFTAPGEHTLTVVLGDGNHQPFDPPVMDKLTIQVS
jgi:hypothetical protein